MEKYYKIVSDGHANNTKIFDNNGNQLKGIQSITIKAELGRRVKATLEITGVELELSNVLINDTLKSL